MEKIPSLEKIIFVGTAGSYDRQQPIPSLCFCAETEFVEPTTLMGMGYSPGAQPILICQEWERWGRSQHDIVTQKCVTTPSITTDVAVAQKLTVKGQVENLELYGVAFAAEKAKKKWCAFLGLSNTVCETGHEQWKTYHLAASLKAQTRLLDAAEVFLL